jgi:hypothetical protein
VALWVDFGALGLPNTNAIAFSVEERDVRCVATEAHVLVVLLLRLLGRAARHYEFNEALSMAKEYQRRAYV